MLATAGSHRPSAGHRLSAIDALRGVALLAMVVFHAGWDMAWVGLLSSTNRDVPAWWQGFGDAVAAAFLVISGFSLVLAHLRRGSFTGSLRRVGMVLLSASLITVASWLLVPRMVIVMGILHCIAIGNLVGLALLRAPVTLVAFVAAVLIGLPLLPLPAAIDAPAWAWVGLGIHSPDTLDYRPICPWVGVLLVGLIVGRATPPRCLDRLPTIRGLLPWAGRHSLVIYLLHQAVLFPAIAGLAVALGGQVDVLSDDAWSRRFENQCVADCGQTGAAPRLCTNVCHCVVERISSDMPAGPAAQDRGKLSAITRACFADVLP